MDDAPSPRGARRADEQRRVLEGAGERRRSVREADPVRVEEGLDSPERPAQALFVPELELGALDPGCERVARASRRVSVRTFPPRSSSSSAIARPVNEKAPVTTSI